MILFIAHMTTPNGLTARGLHIRFLAPFGVSTAIGCRVERLADGLLYDFNPSVQAFVVAPQQPFGPTVEQGMGLYSIDMSAPVKLFPAGDYCISLHDNRINNQAFGLHLATLV